MNVKQLMVTLIALFTLGHSVLASADIHPFFEQPNEHRIASHDGQQDTTDEPSDADYNDSSCQNHCSCHALPIDVSHAFIQSNSAASSLDTYNYLSLTSPPDIPPPIV